MDFNIFGIFKWLFDQFSKIINFLFSAFGLLITGVVGLVSTAVQSINFFTGPIISANLFSTCVNGFQSGLTAISDKITANEWLCTACYVLNVDGFATCFLSVPIIVIGLFVTVMTFIISAFIPLIIAVLGYKIYYKIMVAIVPEGWRPSINIDCPDLSDFFGKSLSDVSAI